MLCFLWQCLYNTGAQRPHTAPRDPEMRVNKPGEPSLTPCVATYSADWWENKAGSSMINTSPFLRMICYGLRSSCGGLIRWLACEVTIDLDQNNKRNHFANMHNIQHDLAASLCNRQKLPADETTYFVHALWNHSLI